MDEKDIDFLARYYRDGVFSPENGWRKFKSTLGLRGRRFGIAAAVAAIIAVTSTAAIIRYEHQRNENTAVENVSDVTDTIVAEQTKVLEFDHTRLTEVVKIVESEYSVEIGNIPDNSDEYVLTLRYEGTPSELVEAINEILGLHLILKEK